VTAIHCAELTLPIQSGHSTAEIDGREAVIGGGQSRLARRIDAANWHKRRDRWRGRSRGGRCRRRNARQHCRWWRRRHHRHGHRRLHQERDGKEIAPCGAGRAGLLWGPAETPVVRPWQDVDWISSSVSARANTVRAGAARRCMGLGPLDREPEQQHACSPGDEFASVHHWTTSVACNSRVCGSVNPRALAVVWLSTR